MRCDFSRVTICGESKLKPDGANYLNFKTEPKKERDFLKSTEGYWKGGNNAG